MIEKLLLNRTHDWSRTGSLRTGLYSLSNSPAVCIILQLIEMMIHCWSRIASLQSVATVWIVLHAAKKFSYWKIKKRFLSSQPENFHFKVDGHFCSRFCSIPSAMTELTSKRPSTLGLQPTFSIIGCFAISIPILAYIVAVFISVLVWRFQFWLLPLYYFSQSY